MAAAGTRNLGRISEIAQVAVRHGFGYFFETHKLTDLLPGRGRSSTAAGPQSQRGQHLREMLDELGPTFVKFGQLLSTRPDIVPPDIVAELRALQDDVHAVPVRRRRARRSARSSSSRSSSSSSSSTRRRSPPRRSARCTARRCRTAAASPSRCSARTRRGRSRPTSRCSTRRRASQGARPRARLHRRRAQLVDEFARSIRQELDYRLEARNAEAFHRNFAGHPHVRIPRVYWSYTRAARAHARAPRGRQLADLDARRATTLEERRRLAYLIAETWMTMIFRHGFFHGDPHPANILVLGDPSRSASSTSARPGS